MLEINKKKSCQCLIQSCTNNGHRCIGDRLCWLKHYNEINEIEYNKKENPNNKGVNIVKKMGFMNQGYTKNILEERLNNDIRSSGACNLCKSFGYMFMINDDFCRIHRRYDKGTQQQKNEIIEDDDYKS